MYVIITGDADKIFVKMQHPLIDVTLSELEIDGNYLNQIKILFDGEIKNDFPLRLKTRQGCLFLTFIQHSRWHDYVHSLQITIKYMKLGNFEGTRSNTKMYFYISTKQLII